MSDQLIHLLVESESAIATLKAESIPIKAKIDPFKYNKTERKIISLLVENTGCHILDSGGAYGRHFERNRGIENWNKTPIINASVSDMNGIHIEAILNIYHYLKDYLEYDSNLDKEYKQFEKKLNDSGEDLSNLQIMEKFIKDKHYENEYVGSAPFNTCNQDTILSQDIQGIMGEKNGRDFVLLQIHNGCDIRGGYTNPVPFYCDPDGLLCKITDLTISCKCGMFDSDDCGYHWYEGWINEDKKQTTLDGNNPKLLHCKRDNPFPREWVIEDDKFICKVCGEQITMFGETIKVDRYI
jgi:hypothetical protein